MMICNTVKRFVREDEGMEMVEWAIVGVVFALAAATVWTGLKGNIQTALTAIGNCVATGSGCTGS